MKCCFSGCKEAFTTDIALWVHKQDKHGYVPTRRPRTNTTAVTAAAGGSGRTRSRREKAPRRGSTQYDDRSFLNMDYSIPVGFKNTTPRFVQGSSSWNMSLGHTPAHFETPQPTVNATDFAFPPSAVEDPFTGLQTLPGVSGAPTLAGLPETNEAQATWCFCTLQPHHYNQYMCPSVWAPISQEQPDLWNLGIDALPAITATQWRPEAVAEAAPERTFPTVDPVSTTSLDVPLGFVNVPAEPSSDRAPPKPEGYEFVQPWAYEYSQPWDHTPL